VQRAVIKPADARVVFVIDILHLGIRLHPVKAFAVFRPKLDRVIDRLLVHRRIFLGVDFGVAGNGGGNRESGGCGCDRQEMPPVEMSDYSRITRNRALTMGLSVHTSRPKRPFPPRLVSKRSFTFNIISYVK